MRILFTSDLHGYVKAYEWFAKLLKERDYDVGVIAGDMMDKYILPEQIKKMIPTATEDDFLQELQSEDESIDDVIERIRKRNLNREGIMFRALDIRERELRKILATAEKPIFVVRGNHDQALWNSGGNIYNAHDKRYNFGKYNFVGYRYTRLEKNELQQEEDLKKIAHLVDNNTILVTHSLPHGVLDSTFDMTDKIVNIGSKPLKNFISLKRPRLHLFGHVYESFGKIGKSYNGSFPIVQKFVKIEI
jgi:Icc-related predicted phosphoesterase